MKEWRGKPAIKRERMADQEFEDSEQEIVGSKCNVM